MPLPVRVVFEEALVVFVPVLCSSTSMAALSDSTGSLGLARMEGELKRAHVHGKQSLSMRLPTLVCEPPITACNLVGSFSNLTHCSMSVSRRRLGGFGRNYLEYSRDVF